jgi:hypothetical protein
LQFSLQAASLVTFGYTLVVAREGEKRTEEEKEDMKSGRTRGKSEGVEVEGEGGWGMSKR